MAKGHVFDERAQLHERREMVRLDKVAVGSERQGLGPLPGIRGVGHEHDADVRSLGDGLDLFLCLAGHNEIYPAGQIMPRSSLLHDEDRQWGLRCRRRHDRRSSNALAALSLEGKEAIE